MSTTTPILTGSQKKIDWAEKIRAAKLTELEEFVTKMEALKAQSNASPEQIAATAAKLDAAVTRFRSEARADYWINNRDASVQVLIKEIARSL